jgi:uncharacterized caspase-like protein
MLDACRDNPFEKTMQRTIALKLVNRGFSNIEPEAGFMVVYAAKHGETALDGDSFNSPFATVLARVIKEPRIEVRKLFDIVRDDVWKVTNRTQQPFTYGSLPGARIFTSWRGKIIRTLMVRRRDSAVSNQAATIPPAAILRDAASRLLRA